MSLTSNPRDLRLKALLRWLPVPVKGVESVAGDASMRRYFRVHTADGPMIAMDAPPPEDVVRFADVAGMMRRMGVRVPEIYALEASSGFALLEDFGNRSYLSCLDDDSADRLYDLAQETIVLLQTGEDRGGLPCYSRALLQRELEIFRQWFLDRWLGIRVDEALWRRTVRILLANALEQPRVCVHRDFHSRNLMVLEEGLPGVLDFQDAVKGPVTYDPVSLLKDCYIAWPQRRINDWSERYRQRLERAGMKVDPGQWRLWFDLMGAQRHLKAAGIFARLWVRDGRRGYLADIPRTLGYVVSVSERHAPLQALGDFLKEQVIPKMDSRL